MIGDPVEVDWEQFKTDYVEGKINPNQNVTVNGTPVSVPRLLEIIEDAEDNATIRAVRKAKLEEEQFQKTAPWWLKRNARWLITLGIVFLVICAPWLLCSFFPQSYEGTTEQNLAVRIAFYLLWLFYYHVGGAKRYNNIADFYRMDEHDDIIREIERKRKRRRKSGNDKDGGKDHS